MNRYTGICVYIIATLLVPGCKKPYEPEIIKQVNNYLVVEGVINGNANSVTTISLSRLRRLSDSSYNVPELNATIRIEQETGSFFPLYAVDSGSYSTNNLTLDPSKRYRLLITTVDGDEYTSDFTSILQTPSIDSVTWEQDSDAVFYVNTHDPLNQTHYYRWDYVETWEYHSFYNTLLKYENDTVVYDFVNSTHVCWKSDRSTDIFVGSSIALSSDVISHAKLGTIPQNSPKGSERYSVLVSQYALNRDAYQYWQVLQKTSQQLGTLFDVQPSQLQGNIHSTSNPAEPVIGYISASTITSQRIFIDHSSLRNWRELDGTGCDILGPVANVPDIDRYVFGDGLYSPYYFAGAGLIVYARTSCLDCRTQGGKTDKPSFW